MTVALLKPAGAPEIVICGDLPVMTAEGLLALAAANCPPRLFTRGLDLVRVLADDEQRPAIQPMDVHALRGELARAAAWVTVDKKGDRRPAHPPMTVAHDIRSLPDRGDGFPPLAGIIEAPALRPDGTIISTRGYDPRTRLYYEPAPGLEVPPIADRPTAGQVVDAVDLIEDAIGEFPFVGDAARANAYALLLTPVVRPAVAGPVPLALLDAPQQGTGKSLLAAACAQIATGRSAATRTAPETEEEWRKALASMLRAGAGFVMFDNIRLQDWRGEFRPLESAALAAVITAWPSYSDRILGASQEGRWPVRQTWVATGNNIQVGGDLLRRCYRVRLDAKSARPWQGRGFRHPQLLPYVSSHRGELLAALLTIARAWFAAGKPRAAVPDIASFECWSEVVGGILAHAGITGFLGDLDEFYRETDEGSAEWAVFLDRWLALWPSGADPERSSWRTTRDVLAALPPEQGGLRDVLPSELVQIVDGPGSIDRKFGRALKHRAGVRVDDRGLRLEKGPPGHANVAQWRAVTG